MPRGPSRYFGTAAGLYFDWLQLYTRALLAPSLVATPPALLDNNTLLVTAFACTMSLPFTALHCVCDAFSLPFTDFAQVGLMLFLKQVISGETLPLPSVPTAFRGQSTGFVLCVPTAFAAQAPPLPCGPSSSGSPTPGSLGMLLVALQLQSLWRTPCCSCRLTRSIRSAGGPSDLPRTVGHCLCAELETPRAGVPVRMVSRPRSIRFLHLSETPGPHAFVFSVEISL